MVAEIRSEIQNEVQAAFQNTQTTILDSMTTLLDNGLGCFSRISSLLRKPDSSEAGWRVVTEYTANPLAENSEDKKRMYKAQTRAEAKIRKEKLKRKPASSSTEIH
ncbi:Hypothetical predicted protein [Mytilus galloprovincialis]|uniref:Uncharacterized protein n=1 Tax=Mytilus galloprovincialis TaxID=29158 RepID=A0A8B6BDZ3_MYTGA|nr:Hypothetical predicted protein [Mytilus galloprovincialis]